MWYVSEFSMYRRAQTDVEHHYYDSHIWLNHKHFNAEVVLTELGSGKTIKLFNTHLSETEFLRKVTHYDPYGFGISQLSQQFDGFNSGIIYYFSPVTEAAIQLLDYVESVESLGDRTVRQTEQLNTWFLRERSRYNIKGFLPIDEYKSLFKFDTVDYHGPGVISQLCTLLEVMRMCLTWWHGDNFYIVLAKERNYDPCLYKLSFTNPQKARTFIAKALMLTEPRLRGVVQKLY